MWAAATAWLIAFGAVLVSVRRLGQLERATRRCRQRLDALRRPTPPADRAAAELVASLEAAPPGPARVAIVNEQLEDIARVIDVGARVPEVAASVALRAGVALALVELLRALGQGPQLGWTWAALAAGVVAYGVCADIGRRAKRRSHDLRARGNELGRLLAGHGLADRQKVPLS